MNIAEASIRRKTVTLVFAVLMVVLGIWSYMHLPRLEDPEFTIKDALIITPYPGASAQGAVAGRRKDPAYRRCRWDSRAASACAGAR
jgi:hypothetical protein